MELSQIKLIYNILQTSRLPSELSYVIGLLTSRFTFAELLTKMDWRINIVKQNAFETSIMLVNYEYPIYIPHIASTTIYIYPLVIHVWCYPKYINRYISYSVFNLGRQTYFIWNWATWFHDLADLATPILLGYFGESNYLRW